jgi:hypothetical protein
VLLHVWGAVPADEPEHVFKLQLHKHVVLLHQAVQVAGQLLPGQLLDLLLLDVLGGLVEQAATPAAKMQSNEDRARVAASKELVSGWLEWMHSCRPCMRN